VSPALVAEWNRVGAQAAFKAGQAVVVYLPARAAATKKARPTTRAAAPERATRSASSGRRQHH
jgi:membrane-bound lytic murein transglycosylase D